MASNKRKTAHDRALGGLDQPSTTLSFLSELRELKGHLECSRHPGRHCYVSPINGDHIPLDIAKLTLWAKKMVCMRTPSGVSHVDKSVAVSE